MSSDLDTALIWNNQVDQNVVKAGMNEMLLKQLSEGTMHMSALLLLKIAEIT